MYVGLLVSRRRSTGLDSPFGINGLGDGVYVGLLVPSFPFFCFSRTFGVPSTLGLSNGFASTDCSLFFLFHQGISSRVPPGRFTGDTLLIGVDSRSLEVVTKVVPEDDGI